MKRQISLLQPRLHNGFKSKIDCRRAILDQAGVNVSSAFGKTESNPKVHKNMAQNVATIPHNLSPAESAGFNTCAMASPGCIAACLNTAGNPVYLNGKIQARYNRTQAFFKARKAYLALMAMELESHVIKCEKLGLKPGARLNTTSDIQWESVYLDNGKTLFELFPQISFYDYSKIKKRMFKNLPNNYHLTFSKTESNWADCLDVLKAGHNVAAVFDTLPESYMGFPVINGDLTDYRPSDESGVIVGLKAKGEAITDESGFVIRIKESV